MAIPLTAIGAGLGVVQQVGQWFGGKSDEEKAREELSRLKSPFYKIQDEYIQNRNQAAAMAQQGLPQATKDYLTEQSQLGLGSAIGGISQTGGSPNGFSSLFESFDRGIRRTAAEDAAAQLENIKYFQQANKDLAGQKTMQWSINEYQPYQAKLKELTQRIGAAKTNQNNALQGAISGLGAVGTAVENSNLMSKLFGNTDPRKVQDNVTYTPASSKVNLDVSSLGIGKSLPEFNPYTPSSNFTQYPDGEVVLDQSDFPNPFLFRR